MNDHIPEIKDYYSTNKLKINIWEKNMYVLIYFYLSHNLIVSKNYFIFFFFFDTKRKEKLYKQKIFFIYLFIKEVNFKTV